MRTLAAAHDETGAAFALQVQSVATAQACF
jgi:hypothetical protein